MAFNAKRGAELVEKAALRGLDQSAVEPNYFDFSFNCQFGEDIQKRRFADAGNPVQMNDQRSFLRNEIAKMNHFSRSADDTRSVSRPRTLRTFAVDIHAGVIVP
jgi:hypothetical protein